MSKPGRPFLQVSGSTESIGALDILAQIKADFNESRSILLETARARSSFFSSLTGNRSKLNGGAKELEKILSDIIDKLNEFTPRTDIPLENLSRALISMRQIEKKLRDNIIDELKAGMIDKKHKVDYEILSKHATAICSEAMGVYKTV